MKKAAFASILTECILLCLLAGSLSSAILYSLRVVFSIIEVLVITTAVFFVLKAALYNRLTALLCIPLLVIGMLLILLAVSGGDMVTDAIAFFNWLWQYAMRYTHYDPDYRLASLLFITIATGAIFHVLAVRLRLFTIPFIIGTASYIGLWFMGNEEISTYIRLYALGSILMWGSSYHESLSKKFRMPPRGYWQACTLLLAAAIVITSGFLIPSQKSKNLKWKYLVEQVDRFEERVNDAFGFNEPRQPFRLSQTGFPSSSSQLGGPVMQNTDLALLVDAPFPLYLRGSILNEYTGSAWLDTVEDLRYKYRDNAWKQARSLAYDLDEPIWREVDEKLLNVLYYRTAKAVIIHAGIKISTIFHPMHPTGLETVKGASTPYYNTRGEMFTTRDISPDEPYTITAMIPNTGISSEFTAYIRESSPTLDWSRPVNSYYNNPAYAEKLKYIRENYTRVPESVTERTKQLVELITEGKDTAYDKIVAIQEYLKANYDYTLAPQATPSGKDFVDYFLFDLQRGYCTYFASALAVMGRVAGVPTRYIEGYLMPSKQNKDGLYEVRNTNGHAWVEVYFPEIGWLTFDPTPSGSSGDPSSPSGGDPYYDRYWEEYWRHYYEQKHREETNKPPQPAKPPQVNRPLSWYDIGLAASLALSGIVAVMLLILIISSLRHRRILRMPLNKQLHYYYREILWLLKLYEKPIKTGETPYRYAERVDTWLVNPEGTMTDISKLLVESEFGHRQLQMDDIEHMKAFYSHLLHSVRKVLGYPRFIVCTLRRRFEPWAL